MSSTSNLFSLFDDSDFDDVALDEPVSEKEEKDIKQLDKQTSDLSNPTSKASIQESEKDSRIKQTSLFDDSTETTITTGDTSVGYTQESSEAEETDVTLDLDDIEEEEAHYNPLDHLFDMDSDVLDQIEKFQSQYQEPTQEENPAVEDAVVQEIDNPSNPETDTTAASVSEEPSLFGNEPVIDQAPAFEDTLAEETLPATEEPSLFGNEPVIDQAPAFEDTLAEETLPATEEPSLFDNEPVVDQAPAVENTMVEETPVAQESAPTIEEPSLFEDEPVVDEAAMVENTVAEEIKAIEEAAPAIEEQSLFDNESVVNEAPMVENTLDEEIKAEEESAAAIEDITPEADPVVPQTPIVEETTITVEAHAEEIPFEEAPVEDASVEEAPVEDIPAEEAPVEDVPFEEAPVEDAPVEEVPVEEAPVEDAPVEEVPVEEAPVEDIPAEEAPVEEAPVEEAPIEEVPVEDIPAEEAPVEEAPVEEAPVEDSASIVEETAAEEVLTETAAEEVNVVEEVKPVSDVEAAEDEEIVETVNLNQDNASTAVATGLLESGEMQRAQEHTLENLQTILLNKANKVNMANENPKTYTFEEAQTAATEYFGGDELAGRVWTSKYALKDSYGNLYERTPDDMHHRIAREISRIENNYPEPMSEEEVYGLLKDFKYIVPQGSPMTGIGNNFQVGSLSNCFVIGLDGAPDSYGGVIRIDEEQVQLMKRRGGVGHDLSHIRPKGTPVKNSALTSTGLVPFMERYSNSTREVAQDGRRGALMLTVSIKHPDSEAFIDAKLTEGKITGANVSVRIDDEFMKAAAANQPYEQRFPVEADLPAVSTKEIDANALWHKITHNAWQSAEPGVLFWDTIIRESVPDCYADLGFKTISTNPCGEIPLCPYDSCRLLAINLYSYVKNPFTPEAEFDFDLFRKHVGAAQRIMDDIIDLEMEQITKIIHKVEHDPEIDEVKQSEKFLWEKIRNKTLQGRRTGVGTTGEGDMLAALGLRYGTPEATEFSVNVHKTLALAAYNSSVDMARTRGAFPIFDAEREKNNPYINRLKEADPQLYENMLKYGRRNIACLTIAPTGTTSLMTQTTSGIEPVFMPVYKRRRKVNPNDQDVRVDYVDNDGDSFEEFVVFHPKFMEWMKVKGIEPRKNYTQEEIDNLVAMSPYAGASANEIDWMEKVRMQGAIQKWVDHSISVTINLPSDVTPELVNQLYVEAWKAGCKGCTVYRDGCRSGVLVSLQKSNKKTAADQGIVPHLEHRPTELEADVVRFQNNKEKWIAFVGLIDGRPYEIFTGIADDEEGLFIPKSVTKGKIIRAVNEDGTKRYDFQYVNKRGYKTTIEGLSAKFNPEYWNYAKLISGVLRMGMPIDLVVKLVGGLSLNSESINTWKMGVERALKKYIVDGTKASGQCCPNCGQESLVYQEGCLICTNCGTSKCG